MATKKLGPVKCPYCGKTFDRNLEEFVQINSRRYAHKLCYDQYQSHLTQEEKDLEALHNYIKQLFKTDTISARIEKQIKDYHNERNYTYSGICKSLIYFYQVKGNSIERANGGIGIVPYVYEDARNYYTAIFMAQQSNQAKPVEQWKPKVIEVIIPPPVSKPIKSTRFSFLDEEE
jgi:hypothetical protein